MTFRPLGRAHLWAARFEARPNRFLLRCRLADGRRVRAFLPNPGRLEELLFPGCRLTLVPAPAGAARRTRWTCVAVARDGDAVFLDTHRTNHVARHLIEAGRIPALRGWSIEAAEVTVGHSRFDFLLSRGRRRLWLEVKSCTLFGNGTAMFPDAVTERGRRHLQALAQLRREGAARPVVLFLVGSLKPRWFLPDYHTDLAFSRTFLDVHHDVRLLPVGIGWHRDLSLRAETRTLRIPWAYLEREVHDRGAYLLLLRLARRRRLAVGRLGELAFEPGWYVYVGSAMVNLTARVERHLRRRKRHHWHVDALRTAATEALALPIRASQRRECALATDLGRLLPLAAAGFGSSDCDCPGHLFAAGRDTPLDDRRFHELLQRHRMPHPRRR